MSRKVASALVLLATGATIFYFARYDALSAEHDQLARRQLTLENQKRQVDEARQGYERDLRQLEGLRQEAHGLRRVLPRRVHMASLLDNLHNHAELAGLEISLVQPLDEEGAGFIAKIPVELHLRGQYHELARFFHALGRMERIVNIEDISLRPRNDAAPRPAGAATTTCDADAGVITAQVLATTFRELEEEAP